MTKEHETILALKKLINTQQELIEEQAKIIINNLLTIDNDK